MIALVFWNSCREPAAAGAYRHALVEFHRSLNALKPAGFRYSATFETGSLPWFRSALPVYEDWYVLRDFAAIDALDRAVLDEAALSSHRFLMKNTGAALGTIVGLNAGPIRIHEFAAAHWLSRPGGVSMGDVVADATRAAPGARCSVWTRALGLGPCEHCILTTGEASFPPGCDAVCVRRSTVWHP